MVEYNIKIGDIINNWKVIELLGLRTYYKQERREKCLVECLCTNKTKKEYTSYDLINNRCAKSCGCLEALSKSKLGIKYSDLSKKYPQEMNGKYVLSLNVIGNIKHSAKRRSLDFKLINDLNIFEKYCLGSCFYCGFKPNWPETHNGIDRVDNEKGYIEENCVSCCTQCNVAKNDLNINDFKFRINKLYLNYILKYNEIWIDDGVKIYEINNKISVFSKKNRKTELSQKYPDDYNLSIGSYAQKIWIVTKCNVTSRYKDVKFNLDPLKTFENYILGVCNYCKLKPQFPFSRNGIDKIDPNEGYLEENCVSCCKFCNIAKLDYSIDEFKEWIIRIYNHLNTNRLNI